MATRGWAWKVLSAVNVFFILSHKLLVFLDAKGTILILVLALNIYETHILPFCKEIN